MITLVQHAQGAPTSGSTTCTATLGSPTTAGNTLIVAVGFVIGTTSVSGITLGGAAGNFAQDLSVSNTTAAIQPMTAACWSDPNCAGGQTSVVATFGASTNAAMDVYEVSGLVTASPLDQKASSQNGNSSGTSFDSTSTATTTAASEFWVGMCTAISATSGNASITGPSSPWTNETLFAIGSLTGVLSGYQITSSTGAADYSGTISPASWYAAGVATYQAAASAPAPAPVAVTALAGQTWKRAFQHPQQPQAPSARAAADPAANAGTGTLNDTGAKNATGSSTVTGTGSLADTGVKNAAAAGTVTGTGTLAGAGTHAGTAAGTVTGTGSLAPSGSGGDTPVLPLTAQPGPAWKRQFQHRQVQLTPSIQAATAPAALAGTGALTAAGAKNATSTSAITGTGIITPTGDKGAVAAAGVNGTGALAAAGTHAGTGTGKIAGTGTLSDTGIHNGTGTSLVTADSAITANPPQPVPVIPPGTVTITPAGPNAATVTITQN